MVERGQFLERPALIPSGGVLLEGLWHRGDRRPALLVCPPHPMRGGSMDSPVCAELAFGVSQAGHPTLRFNYRGAGASQGSPTDRLEAAVEDAVAALGLVRDNVGRGPVALAGYDFGAEVAVEAAHAGAEVEALLVVSPPSGTVLRLGDLGCPTRLVVGGLEDERDRQAWSRACEGAGHLVVVIPGADRVYSSGLGVLGREAASWIAGRAPAAR